jgi:hypothetical protein
MLPGLRLVLAAITATIFLVVLAFMQLVKLHVAQDRSSDLAPVEARFAGLAFAARPDWRPVPTFRSRSLEALPPFANILPVPLPADEDILDARMAAPVIILVHANPELPRTVEEREPISAGDVRHMVALRPAATASESVAVDGAQAGVVTPFSTPETGSITEGVREEAHPSAINLAALSVAPVDPASAAPATPELAAATILAPAQPITYPALPTRTVLPVRTPATAVAVLSAGSVPLPAPRPEKTPLPRPKAQLSPGKQNAGREPARNRPASPRPAVQPPPPSSAPTNPFAALFGN